MKLSYDAELLTLMAIFAEYTQANSQGDRRLLAGEVGDVPEENRTPPDDPLKVYFRDNPGLLQKLLQARAKANERALLDLLSEQLPVEQRPTLLKTARRLQTGMNLVVEALEGAPELRLVGHRHEQHSKKKNDH